MKNACSHFSFAPRGAWLAPSDVLAVLAPLAVLAVLLLPGAAWAEKAPVYTSYFSNVAAGGYDVTAYFTEAKPVKGKKAFKTEYMGVDWHFSSRENLDKFTGNPDKYAPQYGGYCAWAVAQGDTASGDPLQWTVHDGKLYLNYNKKINNRWRADMEKFIADGDKNWPAVLD